MESLTMKVSKLTSTKYQQPNKSGYSSLIKIELINDTQETQKQQQYCYKPYRTLQNY